MHQKFHNQFGWKKIGIMEIYGRRMGDEMSFNLFGWVEIWVEGKIVFHIPPKPTKTYRLKLEELKANEKKKSFCFFKEKWKTFILLTKVSTNIKIELRLEKDRIVLTFIMF